MKGYNGSCIRWAGTPSAFPPSSTRVQTNTHPRITTQANIDTFRRQIKSPSASPTTGDREVDTTDPQLLQVDPVDLLEDPRYVVRPPILSGPIEQCKSRNKGKGRPIAELPIPFPRSKIPTLIVDSATKQAYRAEVWRWSTAWPELGTARSTRR